MHLQSYTLRIVVDNAEEMSDKIFVMQRDLDGEDIFNHIASPNDLVEFPENSPDLSEEMPWFRVNELSLTFRGIKELNDVKYLIDKDINGLVRALNIQTDIQDMEEVIYDGT